MSSRENLVASCTKLSENTPDLLVATSVCFSAVVLFTVHGRHVRWQLERTSCPPDGGRVFFSSSSLRAHQTSGCLFLGKRFAGSPCSVKRRNRTASPISPTYRGSLARYPFFMGRAPRLTGCACLEVSLWASPFSRIAVAPLPPFPPNFSPTFLWSPPCTVLFRRCPCLPVLV